MQACVHRKQSPALTQFILWEVQEEVISVFQLKAFYLWSPCTFLCHMLLLSLKRKLCNFKEKSAYWNEQKCLFCQLKYKILYLMFLFQYLFYQFFLRKVRERGEWQWFWLCCLIIHWVFNLKSAEDVLFFFCVCSSLVYCNWTQNV